MMGGLNIRVLSFLILFASGNCDEQLVGAGDSPVTCSTQDVECDTEGGNLLDVITNVLTLAECRQLCLDDEKCNFITYFDDSALIAHLCQMFTTCDTTITCSHCVSENMDCNYVCSKNVMGHLDENVLDLQLNIESELLCKKA